MTDEQVKKRILVSWTALNDWLRDGKATLSELQQAIKVEAANGARATFIRRLSQRTWKMERKQRESDLAQQLKKRAVA